MFAGRFAIRSVTKGVRKKDIGIGNVHKTQATMMSFKVLSATT
tara:strand:+ start:1155 stop:1283 length:129 start_codon:yes stop_codon:yes gene_type:complete